eukprot:scaffold85517_cov32-Tisochrysis_lutea.AAC.5
MRTRLKYRHCHSYQTRPIGRDQHGFFTCNNSSVRLASVALASTDKDQSVALINHAPSSRCISASAAASLRSLSTWSCSLAATTALVASSSASASIASAALLVLGDGVAVPSRTVRSASAFDSIRERRVRQVLTANSHAACTSGASSVG